MYKKETDLEEAMTEVRRKLVLLQIKSSVLEKYYNLQKKTTLKKTSHIGLACQITVAEAILAEKEINCSPPCSQGHPENNVPEVVLMAALGIRRCHGCGGGNIETKLSPSKI